MPIIEKRLQLSLSRIEKFVNFGKRRLRGFASTDALDRQGDVVEPYGGRWETPLPMLWAHRHDSPVGTVHSVEVRGNGLWIEATIAEGIPKADEVWELISAGLVTSYSVGFIGTKSEALPSGGRRWTSWELLEISCVVVPANADAKIQRHAAGIPLIRSGGAVRLTRVVGGGAVPLTR